MDNYIIISNVTGERLARFPGSKAAFTPKAAAARLHTKSPLLCVNAA